MSADRTLHALLERSAAEHAHRVALVDAAGTELTYAELDRRANGMRDELVSLGVRPGDRVGFCLRKSTDAIVAIFGILKCGAAYVPVDPLAPPARNAYILGNCSVRVAITSPELAPALAPALAAEVRAEGAPGVLVVGGGRPGPAAPPAPTIYPGATELAYILYTSGSTGRPKGVMLSHENALSYIDWCSATFAPSPLDRLSSHAPLHFDLSILDLFLAIRHGAALVLIGEEIAKDPARLAPLIAERGITIWYSAPSILGLLAQYGRMERHDYSALRLVLFAGEVFPVKHLRALKALWPHPRYWNLYGPTETNVCTFYEIPAVIPEDRSAPYPIGGACAHYRTRVVDAAGADVSRGEPGELCAAGPAVMQGYWDLPAENARAFLIGADGTRWYKTGDVVSEDAAGCFTFLGRADRMVKRRGYRVELAEIEVGLYRHPQIAEAAVVALADEEAGVRIKAFLTCRGETRPSLIELKKFCAENLPLYMAPDQFVFAETLPKTSTGKIDYQKLKTEGIT